jgi:hypothetical protein
LVLCARCWVLVSSSGIVPSRRYSAIQFCQSALGLGVLTIAATSPSGLGLGATGPIEALRLASDIGARPFSPCWVPGMGIEPPMSGEAPSDCTGISSSSRIVGLNKSCVNTPGGGGSWLDLSQVRALSALLSHQRI